MKVQFLLKNTGMYERLGIMTLSSVLKERSHDVNLTLTEELPEEEEVVSVLEEELSSAHEEAINAILTNSKSQ